MERSTSVFVVFGEGRHGKRWKGTVRECLGGKSSNSVHPQALLNQKVPTEKLHGRSEDSLSHTDAQAVHLFVQPLFSNFIDLIVPSSL